MHLNEFAICVVTSLLVQRRLRRSSAYDGVRALTENCANTAGCHDDRVRRKRSHFHRMQIHRTDATADALRIENSRKKFPGFVFLDLALGLVSPDLLIESVKKLLPGGGSSKSSAVMQRSSEPAKIEQPLGSA